VVVVPGDVVVVARVVVVVAPVVVVVAPVVVVVAPVVVVVAPVVVVVAPVVVVVGGAVRAARFGKGVMLLKTKLLAVQLAEEASSPTQMEQGSGEVTGLNAPGVGEVSKPSSQVTVEPLSKPPELVLWGSSTSGVVSALPVGRIHRSIVKVTLPFEVGMTGVALPGVEVCNVPPSHEDDDVGSRLHSSNLSGWPALKVLLAPIVTVITPASPS
jgi:hypothetical protein